MRNERCLFCEGEVDHAYHDNHEINQAHAFDVGEPPRQVTHWDDMDPNTVGGCPCDACNPRRRHPSSQRFVDIVMGWIGLHTVKQQDYGADDDPFRNVRASEAFGIPAWVGAVLRGSDKMRRLEKAARQALAGEDITMANESVIDSFDDLAVYAGIARVLYEEDQ